MAKVRLDKFALCAGLIWVGATLTACGDSEGGGSGGNGGSGGAGGVCQSGGAGGGVDICGSGNASSGGSGGVSATCGDLNGSCSAPPNTPDGDPSCTDWAGFPAAQTPQFQSECEGDQHTFSTASCTAGGSWNFGCLLTLPGDICTTSYVDYADTSKIGPAGSACESAGGIVLSP